MGTTTTTTTTGVTSLACAVDCITIEVEVVLQPINGNDFQLSDSEHISSLVAALLELLRSFGFSLPRNQVAIGGYSLASTANRRRNTDDTAVVQIGVDVPAALNAGVLPILDNTYNDGDAPGALLLATLKSTGLFSNVTELLLSASSSGSGDTDASNDAAGSLSMSLFAVIVAVSAFVILVVIFVVSSRRSDRKVRDSKARLMSYTAMVSPFESRRESEMSPRPSGMSSVEARRATARDSDYSYLDDHLSSGAAMMADAEIMRELRAASRVSTVNAWEDPNEEEPNETRVTFQNPLYEPKPALRDDEEAERVAQAVLLMDAIRRHDEAVGYIPVDKTSGSEVVDF